MVEKSREDVLRDEENIWGVPLVHPVSDELLEWCLFLVFLERGRCSHRDVVIIVWDGIDLRRARGRYVHSPRSHTSRDTRQMFIMSTGELIQYTTRLPRRDTKLEVCAQDAFIASVSTHLPQITYLFEKCLIQLEGR